MQKSVLTFFFSFIFLVSIITPSLITVLDGSYSISLIEKTVEGEEENQEAKKDLETENFYPSGNTSLDFIAIKTNALNYCYKKYNSLSQKLFSPPPEQVFS